MKPMLICFCVAILLSLVECVYKNNKPAIPRDYNYEHYCDSIWVADKDFYLDVICETQQYQDYIEQHGEWWHE